MLSGYRVVDLSGRVGWLAGRLLADLGAEVVKVEPVDAETDGVDWQAYNANKRLLKLNLDDSDGWSALDKLLASADFLIESAQPGDLWARHLDPARVKQVNPNLIQVSVTPFGKDGPRAGWLASDLELMAAGGAMSMAGEPDGDPVRVTAPQSYCWAGSQAAVGALVALARRTVTGTAHHVDVSAQAAVILALSHAPAFWDMEGKNPTRAGAYISGRSIKGARYRAFWNCADGFLNFALYGGSAGRRTNMQLVEWMRERGAPLGALAQVDWKSFTPTRAGQEEVDELERPIADFFLGLTKREFLEEASRREMLGYPVSNMRDIATDPQLEARGFWQNIESAAGQTERHCGSPFVINGARARLRHRPGEVVALDALLKEFSAPLSRDDAKKMFPVQYGGISQALAGLKVAEFGAYAAGPHIGKMLAVFGATVVHVESHQRPDGFRMEYPPFKDGEPGVDRGGCYASFNDSKYSVSIDLKSEAGLEVARRLVGWSDIVIENMRPGVMSRLGLGFNQARELNPRVVMISTCNMGQTGPRAFTPGFGSQLSALAGFCGLTGDPNGPPMLLYGPYIDFIASTLGAVGVLAGLERSRHAGEAVLVDLSQYEAGLMFVAGALLDFHRNGVIADRAKNRDPIAAPHGAYRCRDGWIALSCWSDDEYKRFATLSGSAVLADEAFSTIRGRRERSDVLDKAVSGWLATMDSEAVVSLLQDARIHSYRVNTIADLFTDPQLGHRRIWRRRRHGVIGDLACYFSSFDLPTLPGDVTGAAPLLGAHNKTVMREFLGMTEEEYAAYQDKGAFD